MKWAYPVKYKLKTAAFLAGILLVILAGNFLNRHNVSDLNNSLSTVVNDRLKPATYIFGISSNLYQKQALQHERASHAEGEFYTLRQKYNDAIAVLVNQYEATVLTKEEQEQWASFRKNLAAYNTLESANSTTAQMDSYHSLCMQNLDKLSYIQVGVGNDLQKDSTSIASNTMLFSSLEMSLLIILGIFTLILLSTTDKAIFNQVQNQALN